MPPRCAAATYGYAFLTAALLGANEAHVCIAFGASLEDADDCSRVQRLLEAVGGGRMLEGYALGIWRHRGEQLAEVRRRFHVLHFRFVENNCERRVRERAE